MTFREILLMHDNIVKDDTLKETFRASQVCTDNFMGGSPTWYTTHRTLRHVVYHICEDTLMRDRA